jgi:hypothetical protein
MTFQFLEFRDLKTDLCDSYIVYVFLIFSFLCVNTWFDKDVQQ